MAFKLDEYANKYRHTKLERRDGILQVTLHTNGNELEWGAPRMRSSRFCSPTSRAIMKTKS
jgi:hypothetical protein